MAEIDELQADRFDFSDDELIRELLDDKTPFLLTPTPTKPEPALNRSISKFYPGPRIGDIETALSTTRWGVESKAPQVSQPIDSLLEKGSQRNKMDNKYTLKIKCIGSAPTEDGYKWRKYGQKSIKNSPNPRSYYRCTNPRCNAKKQVERSMDEPDTLVITYEGLHLHFAYSQFQLNQPPHYTYSPLLKPDPKRPKTTLPGPTSQPPLMAGQQQQPQPSSLNCLDSDQNTLKEGVGATGGPPQGLLEDIVPLLVRNPMNDGFSTCPNAASSSTSSSSLTYSWSPISPFDVDILSASTRTRSKGK